MRHNTIVIIGFLLCGMVLVELFAAPSPPPADIEPIIAKLEGYIKAQGFTWQQIKNATLKQWYNHAVAAGFTPNEIKQFSRSQNVLRAVIVKRMKRAKIVADATALWTHIRKAGPDVETIPLLREIYQNPEVYGVDPNAFN